MKVRHELKTWTPFYEAVKSGDKTFEVRFNDREFKVGDILELDEWDPATGRYTGVFIEREVAYILHGPAFGIKEGYCVMSIRPVETTGKPEER